MKIIVTGSGTSFGMPVIGCTCPACTSDDSRDTRFRPSIFVTDNAGEKSTDILVDVGPEFRLQALRYRIKRLDAVLMTHSHADHCHGLDDLRIFSHTASASAESRIGKETQGEGLGIFANETTLKDLRNRFSYIFTKTQIGGGKPKIALKNVEQYSGENPLKIGSICVIPIPMLHGMLQTSGFLLYSATAENAQARKSIAYLTDCNKISDESIEIIKKYGGIVEHAIIDGLRVKSHVTHCSFAESLGYAERISPRNTWITHICHDMKHSEIQAYIDEHLSDFPNLQNSVKQGGTVSPAYDGLTLEF
jgi:phosphoribosyl 1,2-cyclic phosphate phosphodiesterase